MSLPPRTQIRSHKYAFLVSRFASSYFKSGHLLISFLKSMSTNLHQALSLQTRPVGYTHSSHQPNCTIAVTSQPNSPPFLSVYWSCVPAAVTEMESSTCSTWSRLDAITMLLPSIVATERTERVVSEFFIYLSGDTDLVTSGVADSSEFTLTCEILFLGFYLCCYFCISVSMVVGVRKLVLFMIGGVWLGFLFYGPVILEKYEHLAPKQPIMDITETVETQELGDGIRWAILVAGANGYESYNFQASVCYAYQLLKRRGFKDKHIVVFMYDMHERNPRRGIIINKPQGDDVYGGVPKDYTGKACTQHNLFAVILGDRKSVKGGSGKVVNSGPEDSIFIYYVNHGQVEMPNDGPIQSQTLTNVLRKKHEMRAYKRMVIFIDACNAASMFRFLTNDLNIYGISSSGAGEASYSRFCVDHNYNACLATSFSNAWMSISEKDNLKELTIGELFDKVENLTSMLTYYLFREETHVEEHGDKDIKHHKASLYLGSNPIKFQLIILHAKSTSLGKTDHLDDIHTGPSEANVGLFHLWQRYKRSSGLEKTDLLEQIRKTMYDRAHVDYIVEMIGVLLFGPDVGHSIIHGNKFPIVDDSSCYESKLRLFEKNCGSLTAYGRKYLLAFANMCYNMIEDDMFEEACIAVCSGKLFRF